MIIKQIFAVAATAFTALTIASASERIDTRDYTVYVVSPLDQWSGNTSELRASAKAHVSKETSYRLLLNSDHHLLGHPTVFQGPSKHPIIQSTNAKLAELGFTIPRESGNYFQVEPSLIVHKADAATLLATQKELRRRSILAQGNPETLASRTTTKKVVGSVAALGITLLAADKFGPSLGANMTLGTGAADDLYRVIARYKTGIAPVSMDIELPDVVEQIELRRVTSREQERTGQIITVYKVPKSAEVEAAAMQDALIALSGARKSPDQIQASRAKDMNERLQIWRECVDTGACKNEQ